MLETGKISSSQMAILLYPSILATSILSVPSITMTHAHQDMWLSPIWAGLFGMLTVWVAIKLNRLKPDSTLIRTSFSLLGAVPGFLVGLFYIFYLPHLTGIIIRQYGEFIISNALPMTPQFVVTGSMVLVCAINARLGIEVIGRTSQIFTAVFIFLSAFLFILLIGELHPSELLPIAENGIGPSIKGALAPAAWFSEYILIAFLLPFVNDREKAMRKSMLSVLFVTITMIATNLVCLFLMGDLTTSFIYPVMIAARYITIADFMQHLEAVVIAIWISGIFVKISVFLYVYSITVADWLKLKHYRSIVMPLAFLCTVFAYWSARSQGDIANLISISGNTYTIISLFVLPMLLLLLMLLKNKLTRKKKASP
ncbi:endospore germination permease [Paenibacillus sp. FSL H8-0537]|uniref:GerAB/ArcD/ProY family transporter n=1 Tax=Paenibacillus sp. FSL H8-0537 TaxID=2921399 RepID=UPI0031013148